MKKLFLGVVAALALAACERAEGQEARPLDRAEASLLSDLPAGNVALFGGNYMKLQDFLQSSVGKFAQAYTDRLGDSADAMKKWMACFSNQHALEMAGGLQYDGGQMTIRSAFRGMSIAELAKCAQDAGITATVDADGKFVALELSVMGMTLDYGYLQLDDGALYTRQIMTLGGITPTVSPTTRTDLEADVAGLAHGTAADDAHLLELASRTDRRHTFWIAGSGVGTPFASKVGDAYGSFDFDHGITVKGTIELGDEELARKASDGYDQAKRMSSRMPAEMRSMLDGISLTRDGKRLRLDAHLDDAQIASLMQLGALGAH